LLAGVSSQLANKGHELEFIGLVALVMCW
jgi:hypothetical protein